ncbi:hypothetical protein [Devosia sp. 1635]|uniref:hypothetical protein n=1 Tax=Devosia sp. 1635 TaxID=2726066 RepID=UPI0015660238|nr:hypothetical protein [Devosia sp. 1635]
MNKLIAPYQPSQALRSAIAAYRRARDRRNARHGNDESGEEEDGEKNDGENAGGQAVARRKGV